MIIRTSEETLVFITQPDHAHLARRPMEHCMALRAHPRHASILHAIGEHDNGWAEADAAPTTDPDTGQPLDFVNAPPEARQEVWPRGVARLARDPWAAALVATHAVTIYDRYRIDAAWAPFFAHMEALRDEMLSASGGSLDDLIADYPFVRLGDLISLVFCTGWTEEQRFAEWTVSGSGASIIVTPDPFGGQTIPLEITARQLPATPFRSDAELREKLSEAALTVLRGELRGHDR
jgi:hypothetical protein